MAREEVAHLGRVPCRQVVAPLFSDVVFVCESIQCAGRARTQVADFRSADNDIVKDL
jgi:hypothetical protein